MGTHRVPDNNINPSKCVDGRLHHPLTILHAAAIPLDNDSHDIVLRFQLRCELVCRLGARGKVDGDVAALGGEFLGDDCTETSAL